jgi:hypothetical protein
MWITFFALAIAAAIWFSAANLAIELDKAHTAVNTAVQSQADMPVASGRTGQPISQLD